MDIINKISNNKKIIIQLCLFLIITYIIIPLLFQYFTRNTTQKIHSFFFSLPAYSLILVVFFIVYNRKNLSSINNNPQTKTIFLLLSLALFYLSFKIHYTLNYFENASYSLLLAWALYVCATISLALSIFGTNLFVKTKNSLFIFTIIATFFYTLTTILWQAWYFLSSIVGQIIYHFFKLFTNNVTYQAMKIESINSLNNIPIDTTLSYPSITLHQFQVMIGPPCSGIESLSMFLGLWILLYIYEQEKLNLKRSIIVLILGLIGTFILNILRIISIILIGTKYPEFAIGIFHSQIGWILFSIFILLLLYILYPWMLQKKTS